MANLFLPSIELDVFKDFKSYALSESKKYYSLFFFDKDKKYFSEFSRKTYLNAPSDNINMVFYKNRTIIE